MQSWSVHDLKDQWYHLHFLRQPTGFCRQMLLENNDGECLNGTPSNEASWDLLIGMIQTNKTYTSFSVDLWSTLLEINVSKSQKCSFECCHVVWQKCSACREPTLNSIFKKINLYCLFLKAHIALSGVKTH